MFSFSIIFQIRAFSSFPSFLLLAPYLGLFSLSSGSSRGGGVFLGRVGSSRAVPQLRMLILRAYAMAGIMEDLLVKMSGMLFLGAAGRGGGVLRALAYPLVSNVQKFICDVFKNYYINNILKKAIQVHPSPSLLPYGLDFSAQPIFRRKMIAENVFLCTQVQRVQLWSLASFRICHGAIGVYLWRVFEFRLRGKDFYHKYLRICLSNGDKWKDYKYRIIKYNHILSHFRPSYNSPYTKIMETALKKYSYNRFPCIVKSKFILKKQNKYWLLSVWMGGTFLAFLWGWFRAVLKSYFVGFRYNIIYRIKASFRKESTNHHKT